MNNNIKIYTAINTRTGKYLTSQTGLREYDNFRSMPPIFFSSCVGFPSYYSFTDNINEAIFSCNKLLLENCIRDALPMKKTHDYSIRNFNDYSIRNFKGDFLKKTLQKNRETRKEISIISVIPIFGKTNDIKNDHQYNENNKRKFRFAIISGDLHYYFYGYYRNKVQIFYNYVEALSYGNSAYQKLNLKNKSNLKVVPVTFKRIIKREMLIEKI